MFTRVLAFILFLFLAALDAQKLTTKIFLAALSGFSTTVYGLFWSGWWVLTNMILFAAVGYALYLLGFACKRTWKKERVPAMSRVH